MPLVMTMVPKTPQKHAAPLHAIQILAVRSNPRMSRWLFQCHIDNPGEGLIQKFRSTKDKNVVTIAYSMNTIVSNLDKEFKSSKKNLNAF